MKTILFVCTENIFRSASAELLFKKLLKDKKDTSFTAISAGTKGTDTWGMYPETKKRILFYGANLDGYFQKKLTQEITDDSNVIICMTQRHQKFIQKNFKTASFLFNELAYGVKTDLEDDNEAYGKYGDLGTFVTHTVDVIQGGMEELYLSIQAMDL